jgi:hypothetical protein
MAICRCARRQADGRLKIVGPSILLRNLAAWFPLPCMPEFGREGLGSDGFGEIRQSASGRLPQFTTASYLEI